MSTVVVLSLLLPCMMATVLLDNDAQAQLQVVLTVNVATSYENQL